MTIGIIGYGVVGKAAANTFSNNFNLVIYDKYLEQDKFENLAKCDFVFIMVPTPFDCKMNIVDDNAIRDSLENLSKINYERTVIIKSTVPPGTCKKYSELYDFEIVFNPEFLRESTTPNEDFANQDVVVIGTDKSQVFEKVKSMYKQVTIPNANFYHTSLEEAEMIKCAQNTMLASRVAIANMIFDSCQSIGIEYEVVRKIAFDNFEIIGPHMSLVPGPDGKRGFGGKCLPKDIRAFSTVTNSDLLSSIIKYNDEIRDDLHLFLDNYKK